MVIEPEGTIVAVAAEVGLRKVVGVDGKGCMIWKIEVRMMRIGESCLWVVAIYRGTAAAADVC